MYVNKKIVGSHKNKIAILGKKGLLSYEKNVVFLLTFGSEISLKTFGSEEHTFALINT